jgi:hypothetical protein
MTFLHDNLTTLERGALGTVTTLGTVLFSVAADAEIYLRLGGLAIGCVVGVLTLVSVSLDIARKLRSK